jgi:copper(I)-binding protein
MRRISIILTSLLLAFSLSACGYGAVPETATMGPAGNGADAVIGDLKVQEVLVINDGTNAVLTAVIVNTSDESDTLLGASSDYDLLNMVDTSTGVAVKTQGFEIAPKSTLTLSFTAPFGAVFNVADIPAVGEDVKVNFAFARNGFVKVRALVFANTDYYESVNPSAFALN